MSRFWGPGLPRGFPGRPLVRPPGGLSRKVHCAVTGEKLFGSTMGSMSQSGGTILFDLRVSLPDRPGTLGALATAMGEGGANILSLDVVERENGYAVDDISVEAPAGMHDALRRAAEEVPGLVIDDVRPAEAFRDILAPMELAAKLGEESPGKAVRMLIEHLPDALWASWAAAVVQEPKGVKVVAVSIGAPSLADMKMPWLPLEGAHRLSTPTWMPPRWGAGIIAKIGFPGPEAAVAPLFNPDSAVLVARKKGPRFRSTELHQLDCLARIATASTSRSGPALSPAGTGRT